MRRAVLIGGTAAAVAVAAVTVAVSSMQAGAAPSRHASGGINGPTGKFTVVERALTDTTADIRPKGDSRGDVLAFANPIYTANNHKRIGKDNGSCVRTVVGKAYECSWTIKLPHGSLVVAGPFYDARDSVLAITGGTGVWSKATGRMVLHARNAKGTAYDFTYKVTR